MADGCLVLLVILSFGSYFADLADSKATSLAKDLRPGKPAVSKVDGLSVTLTWSTPVKAGANQSYTLQYQADKRDEVTYKVVRGNWTTVHLDPNTWYTIKVKATSDSLSAEGWSDELRIRSNESRPGKAPSGVVVQPLLPTLHVHWDRIPPEHHNGVLLGYVIFIKLYGTEDWKKHFTKRTRIQIEGLNTTQTYTVRVAGYTSEGHGPQSLPIHIGLKTTPQPFKTSAQSSEILTHVTTKLTVDKTWESTRDPTAVAVFKTTGTAATEAMAAYSQDEPEQGTFLKKFILFGVPAFVCLVLLCCLLGFMLWRHMKTQNKNLQKSSSSKQKAIVTRGENTITYCLPPEYKEKAAQVTKSDVSPYSSHIKPFPSGPNPIEAFDPEKQRIYESMDGLHTVLKGEIDEHRYIEPDQLCVQLPTTHPEPKAHKQEPGKEPQYANVAQSGHLYEVIPCEGQEALYANAQVGVDKESPYENNRHE